ncbi:MAG: hypothetical protein ACR2NZ_25385, partial [Rubripirellula sp.]
MMTRLPIHLSIGHAHFALAACLLLPLVAHAQQKFVANYDESKIPAFQLPDPLVMASGQPVGDADAWTQERRPELLELFASQVYGRAPDACEIQHKLISSNDSAINGKAIRREVDVTFGSGPHATTMRLLI